MRKPHQKRRPWAGNLESLSLWKVTLNWYGEIHPFHTHANSEANAKRNAKKKLICKLKQGHSFTTMNNYFNGSKDNVKAEKLS